MFKALFQKEKWEGLRKRASNWWQHSLPHHGGLSTFKYNTAQELNTWIILQYIWSMKSNTYTFEGLVHPHLALQYHSPLWFWTWLLPLKTTTWNNVWHANGFKQTVLKCFRTYLNEHIRKVGSHLNQSLVPSSSLLSPSTCGCFLDERWKKKNYTHC